MKTLKTANQHTINVPDVSLNVRKHFSRLPCTFCEIEDKIFFNSLRLVGLVMKQIARSHFFRSQYAIDGW